MRVIKLVLNIINGRVWTGNQLEEIGISIEGDKIIKVSNEMNLLKAENTIDAEDNIVFPGCIDVHSHLRDSNLSYKEDFISGTSAALAGGFTTILDMPNTKPPITNVKELIKRQKEASEKIFCNVGFYCSPINNNDIEPLIKSNAIGFKIYLHKPFENQELSRDNIETMMRNIEKNNSILLIHAESPDLFKNNNHVVESETVAIEQMIKLAKKTKCKIHIVHVSTNKGLKIITDNKHKIDISCETTPHHMILNTEEIIEGQHCEPPLRDRNNQQAIFEGIKNGNIDMIATDHAPHTVEEKEQSYPGFPGLEITVPLMFDLFYQEKITLQRIFEVLVKNPVERFKLKNIGQIKEGYNADLILINEKNYKIIEPKNFLSKAKFTPFKGKKVNGEITTTIINGKIGFRNGKILSKPGIGRVLKRTTDFN